MNYTSATCWPVFVDKVQSNWPNKIQFYYSTVYHCKLHLFDQFPMPFIRHTVALILTGTAQISTLLDRVTNSPKIPLCSVRTPRANAINRIFVWRKIASWIIQWKQTHSQQSNCSAQLINSKLPNLMIGCRKAREVSFCWKTFTQHFH